MTNMGRTNKAYLLTTAAAIVATGLLLYIFSTKRDESSTKDNHDSDEVTVLITKKNNVTTESTSLSSQEELLLEETPVIVNTEHNFNHVVSEPLILTDTLETTETETLVTLVTEPLKTMDATESIVLENSEDSEHKAVEEAFEVTSVAPVTSIIESDVVIPQTRDVLETPVHNENATPRDVGNVEQAPLASNATTGSAISTSPASMMKNLHLRRKHKPKKVPNAQVVSVQKSLKDFRAAEGKKKKTKATSTTQ